MITQGRMPTFRFRDELNVNTLLSDSRLNPGRNLRPVRDPSGEVIMRRMCRALALRTRSDERALKYGLISVTLSVAVAVMVQGLLS